MTDAKLLTITLGRLIGGAVLGASLTAAGVVGGMYFVIEMANSGLQAGMQSAIETVNQRIGDTNGRFDRLEERLDKVDDRLFDLTAQIAKGFTDTQQKLEKKASLDDGDLIDKFAKLVRDQGVTTFTVQAPSYGSSWASAADFTNYTNFTDLSPSPWYMPYTVPGTGSTTETEEQPGLLKVFGKSSPEDLFYIPQSAATR
jgi:hypothetical protein